MPEREVPEQRAAALGVRPRGLGVAAPLDGEGDEPLAQRRVDALAVGEHEPEGGVDEAFRAEPLRAGPHDRRRDRGQRQRGVARGAGELIEVRARARERGVHQHERVDQLRVPGRDPDAGRAAHRVAHHDGRALGAEQRR